MHWKATMTDDHRIFADSDASLWRQIKEYLSSHPNTRLASKPKKISKQRYQIHQLMKHDPRYWIQFEQGNDMNVSDGQILRLHQLRNIPDPKTGLEEYIARRKEFEATKPQRPESWSPRKR